MLSFTSQQSTCAVPNAFDTDMLAHPSSVEWKPNSSPPPNRWGFGTAATARTVCWWLNTPWLALSTTGLLTNLGGADHPNNTPWHTTNTVVLNLNWGCTKSFAKKNVKIFIFYKNVDQHIVSSASAPIKQILYTQILLTELCINHK